MEKIKMKTGLSIPDEPSDNMKTFIFVFMCIIWRRVWITTAIYCEHNNIDLTKDVVLKALKYNIFSNAGIGNTLRPYIVKALTDGFLMPQFYEKNIYATRAVKLYKPAYSIIKANNREDELKFLKEYALSIFKMEPTMVNDVADETKDALNDITENQNDTPNNSDSSDFSDTNLSDTNLSDSNLSDSSDTNLSDTNLSDSNLGDTTKENIEDISLDDAFPGEIRQRCPCKLCELVDSWDVNMALIFSDDPFQNVVMRGLSIAWENTTC